MESKEPQKVELIQKILDSYIDKFEDCREDIIDVIYEDLSKTDTWYKTEIYSPKHESEIEELSPTEMISLINDSDSLKDLLEEIYDGSYTYEWYEERYCSMLSIYTDSSDALDFLEMPHISSYIEENYFKEFNNTFKEELELSDDWKDEDVDTYYYFDIIEDYLDSDSYDYIISPEYVIEKWLEEEEVDVNRILKGILSEENLKDNEELLDDILMIKPTNILYKQINDICINSYKDYLSTFVFKHIQDDLEESKNNVDDFNKKIYKYKSICTLKELIESNKSLKNHLLEFSLEDSTLSKSIEDKIFNSYTKEYIINNLSKVDDNEVKNILINCFGEEYVNNILTISDDEIKEYIEELISHFIQYQALNTNEILNLDPYILYIEGAKILNEEPLYSIDVFKFEDAFLEQNFIDIYNAISNLYIEERNNCLSEINLDNISEMVNKANNLMNEQLYDRPTRIKMHIKNIKKVFKDLILKSKDINDNIDIINKLILILSKLESYTILGEIGEESYRVNYKEILNYPNCLKEIMKSDFNYMLKTVYVTENIKTQLKETLCENPKDEFPLARSIKRHFIINIGETNTGKTHNAIQRLKESKEGGVYLAPLRLLALEIQEKLNSEGIPCSLSTGEEEDIIEDALHESLTVEKANFDKKYEVCVIDECQMIGDEQRGYAWTNAILGIYSKEIHLCMAPEALNIVLSLINSCNDTYEIIEHHRKTPLILEDKGYTLPTKKSMQSLKKGDALIVFSKREALTISSQLKSRGISASVIYGALPYQSRKKQFELFLNGETDVVVSTDALGMGVNLPIRRVVFLGTRKYDGKKFRALNHSEVKQISGRAGRQGIYNEGFVNTTENKGLIRDLLNSKTPDVKNATLLPPKSIIYVNNSLLKTIKVWNQMTFPDLYKKGDTSRFIDMLNRLEGYNEDISKEDMYNAITLPFDEKNQQIYSLFISYLKDYVDKEMQLDKPNICSNPTLDDLEIYYKKLDLYYAFGKKFNMIIDLEWLKEEKNYISLQINELIINNIRNLKKKCPQCGKKLDFTWEHKLCDSCFRKNNDYYDYY